MKKDKLPTGVYRRKNDSGKLWISYYDENGKRIRESAKTSDPNIAKAFREKRLREVAEGKLIPTRKFESITFGEFWISGGNDTERLNGAFSTKYIVLKNLRKSRRVNCCQK